MLLQMMFVLLGLLLGSVLFSYHIPLWLKGVDIVALGADRNPGSSNAFRYAGVPVGLTCLVADLGKGFLPVWLSLRVMGGVYPLLPLVMLAPVLGHALSPWYPFHGGKAIATAFGVLIGLFPFSYAAWILVFWYLFFSLVIVIHPNERRSVVTFLCFAFCAMGASVWTKHHLVALGCVLMACVPIHKNYIDIRRAESEMQRIAYDPAAEVDEPLPR